jgi:ketosteroid isomerase-like protein
MTEESTTLDLVELLRRAFRAMNQHDADAVLEFFTPDAIWTNPVGPDPRFEGEAAIRRLLLEWWSTFGDLSVTLDQVQEIGGGIVLAVFRQHGRPGGSSLGVEQTGALILELANGKVARLAVYPTDIDEARAAAERLAAERG